MIVGKHSALKGFSLFFWLLLTILVVIGVFININHIGWRIVTTLHAIVNVISIIVTYIAWSEESRK